MSDELRDNLTGKRLDFNYNQKLLEAQGKTREEMIPLLRDHSDRIVELTGKILNGGDPDPPDPPHPPGDRREFLQIDGMGIFLWFLLYYWNDDTRLWIKERACETVEMFSKYRPDSLLFFAWLRDQSESNAHFKPMCPFPTDGNGFFDISQIKEKYLRAFEEWCVICRDAGIDIQVCVYMARYCFFPFEKNINGVSGFYDQKALPFQVHFINQLISVVIEVYGYIREIRGLNEPIHGGDHHKLHVISNWTRDTYRNSMIKDKVPIRGVFLDESGSAGVLAPFHEKLDCPKYDPDQPEPLCPDGKIGGDLIGFSENPEDRLPIAIINHGYSILKDKQTNDGQAKYIGSAWPKKSSWWGGGDGGTRFHSDALGHKVHENNDPTDPRIWWAQGNGPQTGELTQSIVHDGHERGRNCGYQVTFFEVLQGWPMIENCQRDQYDQDRILKAAEGHDLGLK